MTDIVLESLRATFAGIIFFYLVHKGSAKDIYKLSGWLYIVLGFALIFFGMLIDITDNFSSLNKFIIIGDTKYQAFLEKVVGYLLGLVFIAIGFVQWLPKIIEHDEQTKRKLQKVVDEVKTLSGLIPICSSCKKIRDDKGYWTQLEAYIKDHTEANFTHSLCPGCAEKLYGKFIS